MAGKVTKNRQDPTKNLRATAVRYAVSIEEKKRLRAKVADLVVEAYDLPSNPDADPAKPSTTDVTLFQECLKLFQPSDLDDLVTERNIDNRCGYALCPRPHRVVPGGGEKVWNQKGGKDFKLLSRVEIEKWCSKSCGDRAAFVRAQLSSEPAWLRETHNDVTLLDDVHSVDDLSEATKSLSLNHSSTDEMTNRLKELALERGEAEMKDVSDQVSIIEKDNNPHKSKPPTLGDDVVEGHRPRKVRFAEENSIK